jgi:hypothetical protein
LEEPPFSAAVNKLKLLHRRIQDDHDQLIDQSIDWTGQEIDKESCAAMILSANMTMSLLAPTQATSTVPRSNFKHPLSERPG